LIVKYKGYIEELKEKKVSDKSKTDLKNIKNISDYDYYTDGKNKELHEKLMLCVKEIQSYAYLISNGKDHRRYKEYREAINNFDEPEDWV